MGRQDTLGQQTKVQCSKGTRYLSVLRDSYEYVLALFQGICSVCCLQYKIYSNFVLQAMLTVEASKLYTAAQHVVSYPDPPPYPNPLRGLKGGLGSRLHNMGMPPALVANDTNL